MNARLLALALGAAVMLAGTMPAMAADLKDPLSPLLAAKGSVLCFGRDYAPDHLAQHPRQTTKSVRLALHEAGWTTLEISPRSGAPKRIQASCLWRQGAGIDTSNRKIIPKFDKPAGFDCIAVVSASSAQEGGYLLIDPAQDAKSLTLFLLSPIAAFDETSSKTARLSLELGPEDVTFALTRIDPKACASLKPLTQ
jgi:hypothetical protein